MFGASDLGKETFMNSKAGSAIRYAVNLSGKPGEYAYKLLNATDEFYKDLNYFGKRFGQEVAQLTDEQYLILKRGTKAEKDALKKSISDRIMSNSFEDGGQALLEKDIYRIKKGLKDKFDVDIEQTKLKEDRFKALEYARETSFTSDALFEDPSMTGRSLAISKELIQGNPYLQVFFPFVRTPVNIIAKGLRLTPATHILRPK